MSKFRNRKVTVDGETFDSAKEHRRWGELQLLQRAGQITDLRRQVPFAIEVNGHKVCKYIADAVYLENGAQVVEDVKSEITRKDPAYRLKNKLMRAVHNIEIREV
jgi:hypothetical protein